MESELLINNEFNFEKRLGKFGTTFGTELLLSTFPDAYQIEGQSVYQIPNLFKVVVTCRRIVKVK
jgi:hypothetical protein